MRRIILIAAALGALVPASAGASMPAWSADPMTSSHAAQDVHRTPEIISGNVAVNAYVPTDVQLRAFHRASARYHNRYYAAVDGRPGLANPSTDMLIQWAAHKWGIPVNTYRAIVFVESRGNQNAMGDLTTVSHKDYWRYPAQARAPHWQVYESMGIAQIKWTPQGLNWGTSSLRWQSTAFNLDYLGATLRYYYDGLCTWCGRGYHPHQTWLSIGGWNSPSPWAHNKRQFVYINLTKNALNNFPGKITDH